MPERREHAKTRIRQPFPIDGVWNCNPRLPRLPIAATHVPYVAPRYDARQEVGDCKPPIHGAILTHCVKALEH
jgi:hypothetical protein